MKIVSLRKNNVLVSPFNETEYHGIILPDSGKEKPSLGIIVAKADNVDLEIGDKIIFGKYAGLDLELDNKKVILLHQQDIIATYE